MRATQSPLPSRFAARVVGWQRAHGRHALPWQQTRDPYRIWLSEIMLQQTQVATVERYYPRLLAAFPDVRALAAAPIDAVLERWAGLGYYRRAHLLHRAAREIVDRFGGEFPREPDALARLPGIGRSTAAAIVAFAFGARGAILEGNVKRVLARHRGVDGFPGTPRVASHLLAIAESLLPRSADIASYTQGMMDLGALVCTRTQPRCDACPVASDCIARRSGRVAELPTPRSRKRVPERAVRVLVIERGDEILFEKRPAAGIWPGLLSLPELALEDDVQAAVVARFGEPAACSQPLPPLRHAFTHFALTLHPQRIALRTARSCAESPKPIWLSRRQAASAALPAPIRRIVESLG